MTRIAAVFLVFLWLATPVNVFAKGKTAKIKIQGGDLKTPVAIIDPIILEKFQIWSGLGTSSTDPTADPTAPSFVIDWSKGTTSEPLTELPRYELSFYVDLVRTIPLAYVVWYVFDPSTGQGYVYLPAKGEKNYRLNVSTIYRGVEGRWFHSWPQWDNIARSLIASHRAASTVRRFPGF
jgi:hypothetical protein